MKSLQLSSRQMGPNPDQKCIRTMLRQKGAQMHLRDTESMQWIYTW